MTSRLDRLIRALAPLSRRTTLGLLAVGLGGLRHAPGAQTKRRKRRRRKRHKDHEATCAESCPAPCGTCFHRPVGPPLCGNVGNANCNLPCLSDNDCIGTGRPYCYTGATNRASGEPDPITCTNGNRSICVDIIPCG